MQDRTEDYAAGFIAGYERSQVDVGGFDTQSRWKLFGENMEGVSRLALLVDEGLLPHDTIDLIIEGMRARDERRIADERRAAKQAAKNDGREMS